MAGYHCLMPTAFLSLHPIPNLLAFFFVAFSFPNNPISSHFIALTHNGGDKNEKCPGEGIHRTFIVIHLRHCQIVLAG